MDEKLILQEVKYSAVRSSGAGGQHVNKTASCVMVAFDISNSKGLSGDEKDLLFKNLSSRLTKEGILQLSCEESRSQFRNKALVNTRLLDVLRENVIRPTPRKRTRPTKSSILKNAKKKKRQSEKKALRKKPGLD